MADLILTNIGLQILEDAKKNKKKIHLKFIAIGDKKYIANTGQTKLVNEVNRFSKFKVSKTSDEEFRLVFIDKTKADYELNEVGLVDNNNILLAIYSRLPNEPYIKKKTKNNFYILSVSIHFKQGAFELFNFVDNKDLIKRATDKKEGIFKLANTDEIKKGKENYKAVADMPEVQQKFILAITPIVDNFVSKKRKELANIFYLHQRNFSFTWLPTNTTPWSDGGLDWSNATYTNIGRNGGLLFMDLVQHDIDDNRWGTDYVSCTDLHVRYNLKTGSGQVTGRGGSFIASITPWAAIRLFEAGYKKDWSIWSKSHDGWAEGNARIGQWTYNHSNMTDWRSH